MPQNSIDKPGGPYQKPQPDIYTIFLGLALAALLLAILALYAEMATYQFQIKGGPTVAAASQRGALLALAVPNPFPTLDRSPAANRAIAQRVIPGP